MSVTLPSILTVGFFLIGIGLGMVCILRRSQVSASPQLTPTSWPFSQGQRGREGQDLSPTELATWEAPEPTQCSAQGPQRALRV
jgi:hypothetical protein